MLTGGNEALMNNIRLSLPVRLVRFMGGEFSFDESYTNRLYMYDGLYNVEEYR